MSSWNSKTSNNTSNSSGQNKWGTNSNSSSTGGWGANRTTSSTSSSQQTTASAWGGKQKWGNSYDSAGAWGASKNNQTSNTNQTNQNTQKTTTSFGTTRTSALSSAQGTGWGILAPQSSTTPIRTSTLTQPKLPPNAIVSHGQPFLSNDFIEKSASGKDEIVFQVRHIASVERFSGITVEMLRYFDYIQGGGIAPPPPKTETPTSTTRIGGTGLSTTSQSSMPPYQMAPWKVPEKYLEVPPIPLSTKTQVFGTLQATHLPPIPPDNDEETLISQIKIRPRGFSSKKTIMDSIQNYHGLKTATPGLTQLVARRTVGGQ